MMSAKHKGWLVLCDLDGTLAERDRPAEAEAGAALRWLRDRGALVCLASGKPCAYLAGVARMLGLQDEPLIGENGCVLWMRSQMPTATWHAPVSPAAAEALRWARHELPRQFGPRIFLQPNEVAVTAFPVDEDADLPGELEEFLQQNGTARELQIYRHADSVECLPKGVDKATAARRLMDRLGMLPGRVIAVGDGMNDAPLLRMADVAVRVGRHPALAGEGVRDVNSFAELPMALQDVMA